MKKLICLISSESKPPEQIAQEAWAAVKLYQKTSNRAGQARQLGGKK